MIWYKDERTILNVKLVIEDLLDNDLPESYDKEIFDSKISLLLDHFIDMVTEDYSCIAKKIV